MSRKVKEIIAWGTKGSVEGKKFIATPKNGYYVLHSEELSRKTKKPLNYSATKVYVETLEEAAKLILSVGHHIRVYNKETKQENKRQASEVEIIWA
ncbi:hypothetical protein L1F30_13365 [Simiduia sp. 21SJ11W-1]|uniref:hypothetical protein n=1 Tax=Simiduia sp. 21SJ11W-1 TaxID=2909669 RepID=UPI0020A0F2FA|nr:hypothetical protein [Simiduia sp. 21SJ11W-1]UTA47146.1 hypothetical protein L1F30_13365 [Simiduia sp. 21SJ11W-1]